MHLFTEKRAIHKEECRSLSSSSIWNRKEKSDAMRPMKENNFVVRIDRKVKLKTKRTFISVGAKK